MGIFAINSRTTRAALASAAASLLQEPATSRSSGERSAILAALDSHPFTDKDFIPLSSEMASLAAMSS